MRYYVIDQLGRRQEITFVTQTTATARDIEKVPRATTLWVYASHGNTLYARQVMFEVHGYRHVPSEPCYVVGLEQIMTPVGEELPPEFKSLCLWGSTDNMLASVFAREAECGHLAPLQPDDQSWDIYNR